MSQLTDIYNSLMNDPDIIPPKKMSKDKYVLNMAQQRIKQHENNAEALEMGFAKNYGHFSGGYSAVNKLAAFVNPPEASPPTFFELLQLMKAKQWWKDEDRSGGLHPEGPMNIHPSAVKDLQEKGYNREEISDIVGEFLMTNTRDAYSMSEAKGILELGTEEIQRRISEGGYSDEELKASRKVGTGISPELTTRLRYSMVSVNGDTDKAIINQFSTEILSTDIGAINCGDSLINVF